MTPTHSTRISAHGALLISLVSLGLATWAAGCDQQLESAPKSRDVAEPAAPKTEPKEKAKPEEIAEPKTKTTKPKTKTGKVDPSKSKTDSDHTASSPQLKRLVVTTGVEKREPLKVNALLADEKPIYAFMELANESAEDQYVVVTFEREDDLEVVGHIQLKVPAGQPRWRTWGRTRMIKDAGPWVAVVRTPDGHELAREPFDVSAS